ncbi:MAG TPA: RNA polymerase sigma factor [Phycisphaerales bacterium]|nr:RNA polymerase sigma factor [Phycisphaerales bacterium]
MAPHLPPLTTIPSSPQAFAEAHAALAAWVRRRLAEMTGDAHTAEDLAQKTWLAVWEAVSGGRYDPGRAAISTFVYAVSQNVYRHWARSQATAANHMPAIAGQIADGAEHDDGALADAEIVDELRRCLREGVPGLGSDYLHVLGLIAGGATDRELAGELGVAPSTAHSRKREALAALRRHLQELFFTERTGRERKEL